MARKKQHFLRPPRGTQRNRFDSRLYMQRRGTQAARKSTPWRASMGGSITAMSGAMRSSVDEEETHVEEDEKEEDNPSKRTSRMSMSVENEESKTESEGAPKTEESIDKQEHAAIEKWNKEQKKVLEEKQKLAKTASELRRSAKVAKIEQLVKQSLNQTDKMTGRQDRADVHFIRPKSSPALMAFNANRPSLRYEKMASKINTQFRRLQEEKALLLHEELEHREKQRMMICQNKFIAINSQRTTSFHKALRQMRERSEKLFCRPTDEQLKKKQQEEQGNWLTDLLRNIPDDLSKHWHYRHIIDKFQARYGSLTETSGSFKHQRKRRSSQRRATTVMQIEGFGQQHSKIKFLKVLERLREWEICSPDISAAIEFCREKIVKMPVEQFEEWFQSQFPRVMRPLTAPPVKEKEADKEENNSVKKSDSVISAVPRVKSGAYKKLIRPMTTH